VEFSLKNDESLNFVLEVIAVVIGKLVKAGEKPVGTLLIQVEDQIKGYLAATQSQVLNLERFAPTALVYKVVEFLLRDPRFPQRAVKDSLERLLALTFKIFEVYKENSKYFMITVHSSGKEEDKSVRRLSVLFTDLLDLLVGFTC